MKTNAMILFALVLSLQFNLLFAGNNETVSSSNHIAGNSPVPVSITFDTPREATFEEITDETVADFASLAPVLPAEADFSDVAPELVSDWSHLAPKTPAEADFEDVR